MNKSTKKLAWAHIEKKFHLLIKSLHQRGTLIILAHEQLSKPEDLHLVGKSGITCSSMRPPSFDSKQQILDERERSEKADGI